MEASPTTTGPRPSWSHFAVALLAGHVLAALAASAGMTAGIAAHPLIAEFVADRSSLSAIPMSVFLTGSLGIIFLTLPTFLVALVVTLATTALLAPLAAMAAMRLTVGRLPLTLLGILAGIVVTRIIFHVVYVEGGAGPLAMTLGGVLGGAAFAQPFWIFCVRPRFRTICRGPRDRIIVWTALPCIILLITVILRG